jgi:beta-galactosidase
MGFSAVSFYSNWALLEGKQGDFSTQGIFDLKLFFAAASKAGVYLIAVKCPYESLLLNERTDVELSALVPT